MSYLLSVVVTVHTEGRRMPLGVKSAEADQKAAAFIAGSSKSAVATLDAEAAKVVVKPRFDAVLLAKGGRCRQAAGDHSDGVAISHRIRCARRVPRLKTFALW